MKHSHFGAGLRVAAAVVAVAMAVAGCGRQAAQAAADTAPAAEAEAERPVAVFGGFVDTVELELAPRRTPRPAKPAAQAAQPKAAKPTGKAETIYVETDGAQGRVWGHVTMQGDRGSGTIHDWDENTLSVTVTRHGSELFAVDQNSRQYVFKLKK